MVYSVIIFYALLFFGFRLAVALLAIFLFLFGLLSNRVRLRRIAQYQKKMARTAMK